MGQVPTWQTIQVETDGEVGIVRLNRPRVRNAVDEQMRHELREVLDHISADESIRGVVLTGAETAFCAGGDIRGMQERLDQGARAAEIGWRRQRALHETLTRLYHLDRPTLAAVNGAAYGLGLDLALTCDFVWAADTASMSSSFIKRGLIPDGGGLFHLPRRVGLSRAKELVISGRAIDPEEALAIGLVDRVMAADELVSAAVDWIRELAARPGTAVGLAKGVLNRSLELTLEEVNTLGSQAQAICYSSPDHQNLVRDFLAAREARRSSNMLADQRG